MSEDNITNNFINDNNIKDIFYDERNDMWTINLNINNDDIQYNDTNVDTYESDVYSIEFIMNSELNSKDDDNFPSFYKFLKEKEKRQLDEKNEFLKKVEKYENFEPTSKDLKLLTSFLQLSGVKHGYMKWFMFQIIFQPLCFKICFV